MVDQTLMPAAGRSNWRCRCEARLAVVRGVHPKRKLQPALDVPPPTYFEDGTVLIHCPRCGHDNWFQWRPPADDEPRAA